jgi:hypothetical protein
MAPQSCSWLAAICRVYLGTWLSCELKTNRTLTPLSHFRTQTTMSAGNSFSLQLGSVVPSSYRAGEYPFTHQENNSSTTRNHGWSQSTVCSDRLSKATCFTLMAQSLRTAFQTSERKPYEEDLGSPVDGWTSNIIAGSTSFTKKLCFGV